MSTRKPQLKDGETKVYIYTCMKCKRVFTHSFVVDWPNHNYGITFQLADNENSSKQTTYPQRHATCPDCGSYSTHVQVHGHITDAPCDDRCTHAVGAVCNCSCGGRNHGSAYSIQSNLPEK